MATPANAPAASPCPDKALLEAWRAGDVDAGASLFARHYKSVARFFTNRLGPDCDDLIQATFLGCVEGIERFRGDASFRTLLFAIARNKLLKHLRNHTRDRARFDPASVSIAASLPSSGSVLAARRERQLLLLALQRLPIDTQLMLELYYWENMRVAEIAAILDRPSPTIRTRMARGRQQLARELEALSHSQAELEHSLRGFERWAEALHAEFDR